MSASSRQLHFPFAYVLHEYSIQNITYRISRAFKTVEGTTTGKGLELLFRYVVDDTGTISYSCTDRKVCMVLYVYVADLIKSTYLHTIFISSSG